MKWRILLTAAVAACAALVGAAEPATFVLSSGQRQSGTLIYGRGENNIVDGRFHLLVAGRDESFALDEVVAIEFVGGDPSPAELQNLPPGNNTPVMVMRDGAMVRGQLTNIVSNDNVQWVNEAGQRNNYPINSVARVYLHPDTARLAFNARGSQGAPVATAGQAYGNTVRIDANVPWVDTGISVRRGDRVIFNGSGDINLEPGASAGVAGTPALHGNYPLRSAPAGALIGRVNNGAPFLIGSNTGPITMPADGRLMIGINDDNFADNTGSFSVAINRQ